VPKRHTLRAKGPAKGRSQLAADLLNPVPAQRAWLLLAQGEVAAAADGHRRVA
jgi:hypothetical protein